ncbi:MAG: beta-ketoacyl-ACP synthase I, partial [Methylobacterium sp.]|nr:beta-ketoacyl-ACP synthase I [Methylobacterium sp.]
SLIMMRNGFLCESAHIQEIDPAMADMNILRSRVDGAKIGHVMSNSFGFGGTNATIVLKHPEA